jgi:gliding motility-associated-like protein
MKRHIFTVSILLVAAQLFGQESRFWVGGSGKWADASHWATVSGGEPGATVPESGTSVVFDENSFSGSRNTVTVGENVTVAELKASNADFIFSGKTGLAVKGSIDVDNKVDFGKLRGELVLSGDGGNVNLPTELIADIVIDGGRWTLTSDLTTEGNITLNAGSLNINGYKMECADFTANEKASRLNIEKSTIVCDKWNTSSAEKLTVKADGSEMLFRKNFVDNIFVGENQNYNSKTISIRNLNEGKDGTDNIEIRTIQTPSCPWNSAEDLTDEDKLTNGIIGVKVKNIPGKFVIKITNLDVLLSGKGVQAQFYKTECQSGIEYFFDEDDLRSGNYVVTYDGGLTQKSHPLGPQAFIVAMDITKPATCYMDPINVKAVPSGGAGLYDSYEWLTMPSRTVLGAELTDVNFGSYWQVTFKDAEGCYYSAPFLYDNPEDDEDGLVTYTNQPKEVKINSLVSESACIGVENGKIVATAQGGNEVFNIKSVKSSTREYPTITSMVYESVFADTYTVIVEDGNHCVSAPKNVTVEPALMPAANPGSDVVVCLCDKTKTLGGATITTGTLYKWEVKSGSEEFIEIDASEKTKLEPTIKLKKATSVAAELEMWVTNGKCDTLKATRKIRIIGDEKPKISTGSDNVCKVIDIVAEAKNGGTLKAKWSGGDDESGVTISGLNIKANKQGTYKFKVLETVTESGVTCEQLSDDEITLTFYLDPDLEVTVPDEGKFCGIANPVSVSVKDNNNASGTVWSWTVLQGENPAITGSTAASVSYAPLAADLNNSVLLKVTGTNKCGVSTKDATPLKFYPKPNPIITTDLTKHFCGPDNGELTATVTSGNTINWTLPSELQIISSDPANGQKATSGTATIKFKLTNNDFLSSHRIKLVETNDGGCSSDDVFADVYFDGLPSIEVKSAQPAEICAGNDYEIEITLHNCSDVEKDCNVDSNIKFVKTVGNVKYYKYESALAHVNSSETIKLYPSVDPLTSMCKATDYKGETINLTIYGIPQPRISDDTTVCGTMIDFNGIRSIPNSTLNVNNILNTESTDFVHVFKVQNMPEHGNGVGRVSVVETNKDCPSPSKTVKVTFVPEPDVNGDEQVSVCEGENTCTVSVDTANCVVLGWETESGETTGFDNNMNCEAVYTFTATDKTNKGVKLIFKYKGKGPCDKSEVKEHVVNVKINDRPSYLITDDNPKAVCEGDKRTYKIASGMNSYEWYIGETKQSETSNVFKHTWSDGGSYIVKVKYKNENNCAPETDPTYPVLVNGLPSITITEDPATFCTGNPADKQIVVVAPTAAADGVQWSGEGSEYLSDKTSLTPKFNSPEAGSYSLTVTVTDDNQCTDTKNVTVVTAKSPEVDLVDTIRVCYGMKDVPLEDIAEITGDWSLIEKYEWKLKSGKGSVKNSESLTEAIYKAKDADWDAGSAIISFDVTTSCGIISDSVVLVFLPEMVAAVGSVSPFYISDQTLIEVKITASHKHFGQVGFYLVSPTGKKVKLYYYLEDAEGDGCNATAKAVKDIKDLQFTTAVSAPLDWCNWSGEIIDSKYTGSFGVTDANGWANLYGEDPAKGGWSVLVKDGFAGLEGTLLEASIAFTDKNQQGKLQTIMFDSKAISQPIADHASTSYYVPMGLRTSCYGTCDARAIANAIGGSGLYEEFFWANDPGFIEVFNTEDKVDLCAGTYYVRVVDDNKCQAETSIEVLSPEEIKISEVGKHADLKCFNDSSATITVTSENWIGKAKYAWYDSLTNVLLDSTPTISNLYAGKFRVVVTDVNECMSDTVFTVNQPSEIEIESLTVTPTCGNEGVAEFKIKEGTGTPGSGVGYKLSYTVGKNGIPKDVDGLKAENLPAQDSIFFTITDGAGCSIDTMISTLPDSLDIKVVPDGEILCFGGTTSATVSIEGKDPNAFTYEWSNGQTSATAIDLKAGTYTVTIIDALGCEFPETVEIEGPAEIDPSIEYADVLCAGSEKATIKASAKDGLPKDNSYTYAWYDMNDILVSNDSIFDNAVPGNTYYVKVKDQYCEVNDTIEIANPAPLAINMGTVNASDCAVNNGSAELESVTGGLAPYKYNWYAMFDENKTSVGNAIKATDLGVDFYIVEVTDSLGCQVYDTVEINGGGNIDFDLAFAGVTCTTIENGRAQVFNVTSNGVPVNDAQIAWNGDNSQLFTQLDTVKTLHFGWNKFMVTTADGCRAGRVNIDASQALRADITSTPIVREGNCNGAFEIAISGGSGEYTYSVKDAAGKELNTNYDAQEKKITSVDDLCAGTYYLHVDIEGGSDCPVDESFEIESRKLYYALASQNGVVHVNCKGDSTGVITGQAVGGYYNDEYVYEWRSSLWGEDSVRTTATINGLKTGSYNLKVLQYHESGLVKDTLVYDTLIVVNEPTNKFVVLADSIKVVGTPCYDEIGSISIGVNAEAFHGTPKTYTFSFDEWTSDVVTTTPLLTDLKSGDYRMKVEDENGCSFVDTITVEDLSNFTIDFQTKEPDCHGMNDGFIRLDVKGGNGNLHYSWTRNNVAIDDTTALLVGLDSAAYFVTVIDDSLCKRTKLIELGQPRELLTNVKFDKPIICYGDTEADFHSEPQGGTAGYTFVWTDAIEGDTLSLNSAMLGVGEGSYAIKVVDAHRCSASDTINIVYPDSLFVEMGSEKSECAGATGYAAVKINGGVAPYVVSWTAKYSTDTIIRTDTLLPGVMVDTLSNVGPDMYYVTVVDALGTGCSIADSVEVLDDGDLRFKPDLTNELYCLTNPNGGAMISKVMNGKTFELYTDAKIIWNAGNDTVNIGDTIKTLHYGKNIVEVISMPDGCRKFGELEFTDDYALRILTIDNIPVRGVETATNGALIAEIGGGYPKYTVVWENEAGDTLQVDTTAGNTALYGLSVGKYILNVKDQNPETCELTETIEIKFSPLRDSITVTNVTCNGWSDGKITAQGIGGLNRPYLYEWSSELWGEDSVRTTQTITDLKAGFYVLKLSQLYSTDSVECLYDTIEVTQPVNKLMVEKLLVDSIPSHCYDSIGAIVINQPTGFEKLFGGNAPFTYKFSRDNWSVVKNSANEEKVEVTGLTIGDYNLYVVDSLGCDYNTTITIDDLSEFRIKKVDVEKPICYDDYGTITVTAESKNGGFKYGWTDVEGNKMNDTTNNVTVKSGTYVVKVTDDSLCVKFDTITVKQIKPVLFSVSNTIENSCYNVADGEVKFTKLSGEEGRTFNKFIFLNPDDAKDVKLSVSEKVAVNDSAEFTLKLDADNYNLVSGTYKVRVEDAASCLSEPVDLEIKSKYPQIDISSYVSTADVTGPDCQAYTADGKISNNGWVKINFKQVSGTVSFRFDDRSVTEDQQPTFEKVTSGNHLLTVGYTDKLVCAVTDTIKVNGKNSFAIEEAGFYQNGKNSPAIFTCPDNELSAYVTAKGNFTYSFYAQYIEEPVEEVVVPVDTVTADSNGVAYVSRFRTLRFYADSLNQDSSATETPVVPEEVKKPAYKKLETINGVVYAVFEDSSATNKGWADFMPYGGETYYYVSVSDGRCMDIDSIKATSMKPVNKLNARLGGDESFRSVVYGYEVPEGGLVQFEANTPEFEFGNSQSVFIENYWKWDFAGENEASGLMPEIDFTGNPMVAKAYGDIKVKVTDSVVFTAYDAIYNIDDDLTCYYTDELKVSAISGITPADVFTPNNDGANDVWRIKGLASYENVTIYVFNRWGGRVWQYSGTGADYDANQWDGRNAKNKPLPSGTYYYVIQCSDNVLVGKKVTGPVTIIR